MYRYIRSLNLNIGIKIPLDHMEMIYDCMIHLTFGLEYAHNNNLAHGNLCLQNIMRNSDGCTNVYKINNF